MNYKETYIHTEHCDNCGHYNILAIPKGTEVKEFLEATMCSNCGVKLRKSYYERRSEGVWL